MSIALINQPIIINDNTTVINRRPSVAALSNGDYITAWNFFDSSGTTYVHAVSFNNNGQTITPEIMVNNDTSTIHTDSLVNPLNSTTTLITYHGKASALYNNQWNLMGQVVDNNLAQIGSPFMISDPNNPLDLTHSAVKPITSSLIAAAWQAPGSSSDALYGVYFNEAGANLTATFVIEPFDALSGYTDFSPQILNWGNNQIAFLWSAAERYFGATDNCLGGAYCITNVYLKIYDYTGNNVTDAIKLSIANSYNSNVLADFLSPEQVVLTWDVATFNNHLASGILYNTSSTQPIGNIFDITLPVDTNEALTPHSMIALDNSRIVLSAKDMDNGNQYIGIRSVVYNTQTNLVEADFKISNSTQLWPVLVKAGATEFIALWENINGTIYSGDVIDNTAKDNINFQKFNFTAPAPVMTTANFGSSSSFTSSSTSSSSTSSSSTFSSTTEADTNANVASSASSLSNPYAVLLTMGETMLEYIF